MLRMTRGKDDNGDDAGENTDTCLTDNGSDSACYKHVRTHMH